MINVVINYDSQRKEYKLYEPTTDTIIITANLSETFIKLSEFLTNAGLISGGDILNTDQVTYHLDSGTLISMVESNVNLMKRLTTQAPSIFTASALKFGSSSSSSQNLSTQQKQKQDYSKGKGGKGDYQQPMKSSGGVFSKSSFRTTNKKFGSK